MTDIYETSMQLNMYEEDSNEETTLNVSSQGLVNIPKINNNFISVIYLQNNKLKILSNDFFPSLPNLMWLDLRDNELSDIPKSVKNHRSLSHLLLQNNKITYLPNELGTVLTLKVLQLSGNPIKNPPRDILNAGTAKILTYLYDKYVDEKFEAETSQSDKVGPSVDCEDKFISGGRSYNSVLDGDKLQSHKTLTVQFNEKDIYGDYEEIRNYSKVKGKCPKLPRSRTKILPQHCQSAKYLKPVCTLPKKVQDEKIKKTFLMDMALKKQKDLMAKRDKILQGKRNIELLRNWRREYKNKQITFSLENNSFKMIPKSYPYDTSPEYMTLLSREDIEKDLPDKYKRRLYRKCKPTVPRKNNNDVHLAMKIKQLFENLEAIDLNRETMSPRTEQKVLLGEIQKISEIKQKLMELSTTNTRSVAEHNA
ncbi:leucine-rich repeat-containing protein 1-like [Vanessa atalanta]|uniref:leucine-rich repeat-containing protein 1-like n=1 Tax=Vanessa atalanta TaxID=42275 RepID=UPI001FCD03D1|nr:leucine-rich repeat-containing protein 1-like [Vanessa atalanta]